MKLKDWSLSGERGEMEPIIKVKGGWKRNSLREVIIEHGPAHLSEFERILTIGLSVDQIDSLLSQRKTYLTQGFPLDKIKIKIEIPDIDITLFGHEVFLVTS